MSEATFGTGCTRVRWHFVGPSGVWVLSGGLRVSVVGAGCGGFARGVRPLRPGSVFFYKVLVGPAVY